MAREYHQSQVTLLLSNEYIDPAETIHGVDCSFDESYVLIGKQDIRAINHTLRSRICIEESD
jgi:hypothetical protein